MASEIFTYSNTFQGADSSFRKIFTEISLSDGQNRILQETAAESKSAGR